MTKMPNSRRNLDLAIERLADDRGERAPQPEGARPRRLQVAVAEGDVDWTATRKVCERLFAYRRLHAWPPTIAVGEGWTELCEVARENLDVLPTAEEAVEWANELIARIASS